MPNAKLLLSLTLVSCALASAAPRDAVLPGPPPSPEVVAALRARGPAGLTEALAELDAAPAALRATLAAKVDLVAGQRYATLSRLYWYTDLAQAKAAAAQQHRPILALRMLGRLDEDQSCANSRLFRATLYANQNVSKFLRDNFVLYWSSEREVPKVTIEFGDGRKIATTVTGNSAHYVMTADGTVLDVLPGMYAPVPFRAELTRSLALAAQVAPMTDDARRGAIQRYHATAGRALEARVAKLGTLSYVPGPQLSSTTDLKSALLRAQLATMSKAYIEVPLVKSIMATTIPTLSDTDTAAWGALGLALWAPPPAVAPNGRASGGMPELRRPAVGPPSILDAGSRALVALLHDAGQPPTADGAMRAMVMRLEQHLLADSALNEVRLRAQIHATMARAHHDFEALDAFVYAEVFHTPAADPWLGLLPRTDFTGLPGDGATVPAAPTTAALPAR